MYSLVFVTHLPAFYKVNLYNEIHKKSTIFVIFIAEGTGEHRSNDFTNLEEAKFPYKVLSEGSFQERSPWQNIRRLANLLKNISYKKMVLGGWDLWEYWFLALTQAKAKLCLALESNIYDCQVTGVKGFVKRLFLKRVTTVFASGSLHAKLLQRLSFQGKVIQTKGVGLLRSSSSKSQVPKTYKGSFLYVGRLSKEKNLEFLIEVFQEEKDKTLAIVGDGPDKKDLESMAPNKVHFLGSVPNQRLQTMFSNYDFLILPSLKEPWGLVVEEALYHNCPVIVSKSCGAVDLVHEGVNGYSFDPQSKESLQSVLNTLNYETLKKKNYLADIIQKNKQQVNSYLA